MKKIFASVLLAALALVSCNPNNNEPGGDPIPQPETCDKHDVDWIATETNGAYLDNLYSSEANVYNYNVILANHTGVYDLPSAGVDLKPGQQYLVLDLFSTTPAPNKSVSFTLPDGVYNLDADNTTAANTASAEYTELIIVDADNNVEEIYFANGTVTVAAGIIDAMLIDDAGKVYHVQCANKPVDNTQAWGKGAMPESVNTLAGDYNVPFTGECEVYVESYDDYFVIGKNLWMVYVDDWTSGDEFQFFILLDPAKGAPNGTYTISNDLSKEGALSGYACAYTYGLMGACWMHLDENSEVDGIAPLVSGSVTINVQGETASAVINAVDDLGHKVTGTCNNAAYINASAGGWSLSKLSTGAKLAKRAQQLAPRTKAKASLMIKK